MLQTAFFYNCTSIGYTFKITCLNKQLENSVIIALQLEIKTNYEKT